MKDQFNHNENNSSTNSPILRKLGRHTVFQTPEHYFEKLPASISEKIHEGKSGVTSNKWIPAKVLAFAVVVLVVILSGVFYFNHQDEKQAFTPILSYDDIIGSGMVSQMDETLLLEVYESGVEINDSATISTTETNHLQDYLIENNTDITLIINEL